MITDTDTGAWWWWFLESGLWQKWQFIEIFTMHNIRPLWTLEPFRRFLHDFTLSLAESLFPTQLDHFHFNLTPGLTSWHDLRLTHSPRITLINCTEVSHTLSLSSSRYEGEKGLSAVYHHHEMIISNQIMLRELVVGVAQESIFCNEQEDKHEEEQEGEQEDG